MIYSAKVLLASLFWGFSCISLASAAVPAPGPYLNSAGSPLLPLIDSTKHTLDIEIYTMEDPIVRQHLRVALARNVKIRILHDPNPDEATCDVFGGATPDPTLTADCKDQQKLVSDVNHAGGVYTPFNKKTLCPNGGGADGSECYEHGKIAISDNTTAMISTGNFDQTNMCIASENPEECNRDFSVIENDPTVVSTLESIFSADLRGVSYNVQTLIPASLAEVLTVSPVSLQPLLDLVHSAKKSIVLETQYLKEPTLNAALIEMAKKPGITVSVTTASFCYFSTPASSDIDETTQIYTAFDQAGISSSIFDHQDLINGHPGYMHAKVIVVDDNKVWIGSENGSDESLTENREYGIVFTTPAWVAAVAPIVSSDHVNPANETWQQSLACTKDK